MISQFAQRRKVVASNRKIAFERGHAHQATDFDVRPLGGALDDGANCLGSKAMLRTVSRYVHFQEAARASADCLCLGVDGIEQFFAVDRVNEGNARQRAANLVRLQVADQVPMNIGPFKLFRLVPKFLGPSFAQLAAAGVDQLSGSRDIDVLGYRDKRNGVGRAAAAFCRGSDATLYLRKVIDDRHFSWS